MKKKKQQITAKCADSNPFDWLNSSTGFNNEHLKLNQSYFLHCVNELIPNRDLVTAVDTPKIRISFDTGVVIPDDLEVDYPTKVLNVKEVYISCAEDFEQFKKSKYLYIHSIRKGTDLGNNFVHDDIERMSIDAIDLENPIDFEKGFFIRIAEFTQGKRTVSFSIDDGMYERFLSVCDKMAINKSKFIENNIKEFLSKVS